MRGHGGEGAIQCGSLSRGWVSPGWGYGTLSSSSRKRVRQIYPRRPQGRVDNEPVKLCLSPLQKVQMQRRDWWTVPLPKSAPTFTGEAAKPQPSAMNTMLALALNIYIYIYLLTKWTKQPAHPHVFHSATHRLRRRNLGRTPYIEGSPSFTGWPGVNRLNK